MGCLHNGILLSRKKEGNFPLCHSMDASEEHYANEIRQSAKDKYCMISLYGESNEQTELTRKI